MQSSKFQVSSMYTKPNSYSRKIAIQYITQSLLSGSEHFKNPGMKSICPFFPFCPNYEFPFKYINADFLGLSIELSIPLFNNYHSIFSINQLIPIKANYLIEFEEQGQESLIIEDSDVIIESGTIYGLGNFEFKLIKTF